MTSGIKMQWITRQIGQAGHEIRGKGYKTASSNELTDLTLPTHLPVVHIGP